MRLNKIPLVEKALSQFLNDIRIVRTKHQKSVTVDDYRIRLRKLITNLGDYLAKKKLPAIWPVSLADLQMCVVTESCPLMITPEGQILVPASCPGFLLIEFLSKNMEGNSTLNIEVIDSKSKFRSHLRIRNNNNCFINFTEARNTLSQAASHKKEEDSLIMRCVNELGLIQLDRDDSVSSDAMTKCCSRLLLHAAEIR